MQNLQTPKELLQLIDAKQAAEVLECDPNHLWYTAWPQSVIENGEPATITAEAWVFAPEGVLSKNKGGMPTLVFNKGKSVGVLDDFEVAPLLFKAKAKEYSQAPILEPEIA